MAKGLSERLLEHAEAHASVSPYDDEQAQWEADLREAAAEIDRLNSAIQYEQHRSGRIGTHGPGCEAWGPAHYECGIRALSDLARRVGGAPVAYVVPTGSSAQEWGLGKAIVVPGEHATNHERGIGQRVALLPLDAGEGVEGG